MIVGIIRRKPVLTYASIIFGNMLASVNSVKIDESLSELRCLHFRHGRRWAVLWDSASIRDFTVLMPSNRVCKVANPTTGDSYTFSYISNLHANKST